MTPELRPRLSVADLFTSCCRYCDTGTESGEWRGKDQGLLLGLLLSTTLPVLLRALNTNPGNPTTRDSRWRVQFHIHGLLQSLLPYLLMLTKTRFGIGLSKRTLRVGEKVKVLLHEIPPVGVLWPSRGQN